MKQTSMPGHKDREAPDKLGNDRGNQVDALLTIAEVADYLKLSRRTAWRWCKSGQLPAFKVGHQWRVSQTDLENFIHDRNQDHD